MKRLLITLPLILLTACASASKAVTMTAEVAPVISPVPVEMETVAPTLVPASGESVRVGFNVRGWT